MNCPSCGTVNNAGSKFCIKCGTALASSEQIVSEPVNGTTVNSTHVSTQENVSGSNTSYVNTQKNNNVSVNNVEKMPFKSVLNTILTIFIKPSSIFQNDLSKFDIFKSSAMLSVIISGIATILNLLKSMIFAVIVKNFGLFSDSKISFVIENLKDLNYFELIFKNFIIYLIVIFSITLVYYLASLIVKKETKFQRLLAITSLAAIPFIATLLILVPIFTYVWAQLVIPLTIIGTIYSFVILYEGMNDQIKTEGNTRYYLNFAILSIMILAAYFVCVNAISSGFNDVMNIFG